MKIGFLVLFLLVSDMGIRGVSGVMEETELLKPTKKPKEDVVAQKQEERSTFGFSVDPWSVVEGIFGGQVRGNIRIKDFNLNFAFNPWDIVNYFAGDDDEEEEEKNRKKKKTKYLD